MAHDRSASRKLARTFVLALLSLLTLFWAVVLIATWNVPHALFGWNIGSDGRTLRYITPGGPAAQAGLRVGDRLVYSAVPLVGRANFTIVEAVSPNTSLELTVERNGAMRQVRLVPRRWPRIFEMASHALTAAGLLLMAIGVALVHLRPSRMTWGFLLATLVQAYPTYIYWHWAQSAPWNFAIGDGAFSIFNGAYAAGTLMFVSRFPSDRARGPLTWLDRAAVPLGVAVAALGLYIDYAILASSNPPAAWALSIQQWLLQPLLFVLALTALTTSYVFAGSSDRQRIVAVLATFAFYVGASMTHNVYSTFYTNGAVTSGMMGIQALSLIAVAIAVADGVIRRRVFDVSFAISRTLVYTVLTSMVVGAFVLVDFLSSKLLERFQITVLLEAIVALAFGIWLNALHARIDRFVDRTLFRRRHLAQARLERTGRALMHAESASFVDEALVTEACDALSLASGAVFRRDGGETFVRVCALGWADSHVEALAPGDTLPVHLSSELQTLSLGDVRWPRADIPHGIAQPLIAIPLAVRHELLGFVLYGGHTGGEAIDPDERTTLEHLAQSAAGAYEHLRAKTLQFEINELRASNTILEHEQRLLRQTIDALQKANLSS